MKLWRDPQSGIYQVRFTVAGKRQKHSLKTTVKGQADAEAVRIYQEATTRAQGREPIQTIGKLRDAWLLPKKLDLGLVLGELRPAGFCRKSLAGANEICTTPGISAHRLRGTFATLHSEAGTPIQVIQAMLGHKSAATTMLYLEAHQEKATEQQGRVAEKMGMA